MKVLQINNYGAIDQLVVGDIELPDPSAREVRVLVKAASINTFDLKLLSGVYKDTIPLNFPFTLGGDIAGVVSGIGENVADIKVGDEVYGSANALSGGSGAFAEEAIVKVANLVKKPLKATFEESSALVLAGVSAIQAIEEHLNLKREQKILIHGGAGGIGHLAIQIAKAIGAHVSTTVSAVDADFVSSLGATGVVDYKTQDFEKVLTGYDCVFDTVGGEVANKSLSVLTKGGILVSMVSEVNSDMAKKLEINFVRQNTQVTTKRLSRLAYLVDQGLVTVYIDKVFKLENAKAAFEYALNGSHKGKVVFSI